MAAHPEPVPLKQTAPTTSALISPATHAYSSQGPGLGSHIEYPLPPGLGFCALIHGFLTPAECRSWIDLVEHQGFGSAETDYPPSYRNNDRLVIDDAVLAARLFDRLRPFAPTTLATQPAIPNSRAATSGTNPGSEPGTWRLEQLNERLRFCRYRPGQRFHIHQDGVHFRDARRQSRLTFMIYLTDGDAFAGGDTVFYAGGPGTAQAGQAAPPVLARVRPRAGSLILFDHALWHAGETVTAGIKHILRSDLIYCRDLDDETANPPGSAEHAHDATGIGPQSGQAFFPRPEGYAMRTGRPQSAPPSSLRQEAPVPASGARPLDPFTPAHQGYVWALARLEGGVIASGGRDRRIRLWTRAGVPLATLDGHARSVLALAGLGSSRLASVSRDRTLRLWDLETGRCVRTVVAHPAAVLSLAVLPDDRLATGAADHQVKLWRTNGDPLGALVGHTGWVWALASCGKELLASASEDGDVRLWDASSRACIATLTGETPLRALAVHPAADTPMAGGAAGWTLVTGDAAGWVTVRAGRLEHPQTSHRFKAHDAAVRCVRFLAPGLLVTGGEDGRLRTWHLPEAHLVDEAAHANFVTDVLPLEDGWLSCAYDGRIRAHPLPAFSACGPRPLHRTLTGCAKIVAIDAAGSFLFDRY